MRTLIVAWVTLHIPWVGLSQEPTPVQDSQLSLERFIADHFPPDTNREGLSVSRLHEGWEFRRNDQEPWKPVRIPSSFEDHEGVLFDGIGWYRKTLKRLTLDEPNQYLRGLLRFHGAATKTRVWCDGDLVGEHLGGWTPFICDVSKHIFEPFSKDDARPAQSNTRPSRELNAEHTTLDTVELLVQVDELVGHNSQGFLPVFAPHFGGLWKPVEVLIEYPVAIDAERVHVWGDSESSSLRYEVPLRSYDLPALLRFIDPSKAYSLRIEYCSAPTQARVQGEEDAETASATQLWSNQLWSKTDRELAPSEIQRLLDEGHCSLAGMLHVQKPNVWSPESPNMYDLRISIRESTSTESAVEDGEKTRVLHWLNTKAAFRTIHAEGEKLLLNGKPLTVRGVLNWGYAPPHSAPSLDPNHWRTELKLVKDYGFNLIKFCLWIPPQEYLAMADQMGVLVWMEYPTWHSKWSKDQLPTLSREFDEFFYYDRNHPSVILRSLTCETGPSADIEVIRALYDQCHDRIPNSVVEDDSSWIQWNRVNDFYDDHPYGNNHTWSSTLNRLKQFIAERGMKPLVLGEAIAADTWVAPNSLDSRIGSSTSDSLLNIKRGDAEQPFWLPLAYQSNREWAQARNQDMGADAVLRLEADSLRYAMLMRKYQIESYRNQVPYGGYVVSVIRDFPFAAMGLLDYAGTPKWANGLWEWHGERVFFLKTTGDRKSFWADDAFRGELCLEGIFDTAIRPMQADGSEHAMSGNPPEGLSLRQTWTCGRRQISVDRVLMPNDFYIVENTTSVDGQWRVKPIAVHDPFSEWNSRSTSETTPSSECWNLEVRLREGNTTLCLNTWDVWRLPKPQKLSDEDRGRIALGIHEIESSQIRNSLDFVTNELGIEKIDDGVPKLDSSMISIQVASRFDKELLDFLEEGGRLLMLPDGERGSFPLNDHWFLRGGPIINSESPWNQRHAMLRDLQHFDLAGRVVPDLKWLDEMTPLVMLWDNHDIATVKTHGLVFACRIGKGILLVDAFHHGEADNAAGMTMLSDDLRWLADYELSQLSKSNMTRPVAELNIQSILSIREKLEEKLIDLTHREWRFRPDPKNEGLDQKWNRTELDPSDDAEWAEIRVGRHWDAQGYGGLDGWAWYRVEVPIPDDWREGPVYLWVDGADDYIEIFADGEMVGSSGDRETRQTAFEQRSSFKLANTGDVREKVSIAIRVEDWQGAGGLFRPIWLSNTNRREGVELVK